MKSTSFATKVLNGDLPTAEEWMIHLQQAHLESPGMTPFMFNAYSMPNGKTSYDILAETIPEKNKQTVLDLACGDGHLAPLLLERVGKDGRVIGVDMSDGELTVARKDHVDKRVEFITARTQELPLKDSSVDHVVCHMAFMLMNPVEPVVTEIARVLKKGGTFSAMVPSLQPAKGLYAEIRALMRDYLDSRWPQMRKAPSGDQRTFTPEGFAELFKESTGFKNTAVTDKNFELECRTNFDATWEFTKDMYFVSLLPPKEMAELKTLILEAGQRSADRDGDVTMSYQMRLVTVRRI